MQTATCGALGPRDVLLSCGLSGMAYAYRAASFPRVWRSSSTATPLSRRSYGDNVASMAWGASTAWRER